ncbi:putative transcription factor WD40-like family [Rosa chinensis]|uniref:Putative transcription factor WD40-like family n=1 Tax=Rosa chinensis TaxID=74649 RepID=A0A2P6R4Y5_ROSCH|nr:putative transcription factor WD40-like family [Rosa chinensis]
MCRNLNLSPCTRILVNGRICFLLQFVTESLWSPLGTYLANVKKQGIILFRGTSALHHVATCLHPKVFEVKWVEFSPGENYLVSTVLNKKTLRAVISIFDVKTGKVVKKIVGGPHDFANKGVGASWPIFKWSGGRDDKYFALISKNVISIYEINTFTVILTVGNVTDFSWSPTDAILALFVSESVDAGGAIPALVKLVQIPNKEQLIEKKLSSVSNCKMYWQSNGEYLAMKVDSSTNNFVELFQIKDRGIDNKILVLPYNEDKVTAFAWEPKGHRFAIIQSNEDISFYSMRDAASTGCVSLLTILRSKGTNYLFWSPSGGLIILARLNGSNGNLEFFNVDELRTVAISKHQRLSSGTQPRYVATSTPGTCHEKPSFNVWSFDGHLLYQL